MLSLKRSVMLLALGILVSSACSKKEEETEAAAEVATSAQAPAEKTPEQKLEEEVEELASVIEMPEDFIAVAEQEITETNLEAELAKLEAELETEEKAASGPAAEPNDKKAPANKVAPIKAPVPVNKTPAPTVSK